MKRKRVISMTESELFVREVHDNKMTPINILNWYRNFYRLENNNTEQGIMVNAINDIFMCFKDMYGSSEKDVLEMLEERYSKQAKINSNTYLKIAIGTPATIPKGTKLSDVPNYCIKRI